MLKVELQNPAIYVDGPTIFPKIIEFCVTDFRAAHPETGNLAFAGFSKI